MLHMKVLILTFLLVICHSLDVTIAMQKGKHSFTAYPEKKFVSYHAFVASLSIVLWKKRCITR